MLNMYCAACLNFNKPLKYKIFKLLCGIIVHKFEYKYVKKSISVILTSSMFEFISAFKTYSLNAVKLTKIPIQTNKYDVIKQIIQYDQRNHFLTFFIIFSLVRQSHEKNY